MWTFYYDVKYCQINVKYHNFESFSQYIKKIGRKDKWVVSPVREYATDKGLDVRHWPLDGEVKGYDLGVVASFGRLIPGRMIKSFPQ